MTAQINELQEIILKFSESGWELIAAPSRHWLAGVDNVDELVAAVEQAGKECGGCGCEMDPLYKRFLELKDHLRAQI